MVGFSDAVDKFYEMLNVGSVYTVTKGVLKPTNKARAPAASSRRALAFETRAPWRARSRCGSPDAAARSAAILASQVRV